MNWQNNQIKGRYHATYPTCSDTVLWSVVLLCVCMCVWNYWRFFSPCLHVVALIHFIVSNHYNWWWTGITIASFRKIEEFSADKEYISNYLEHVEIVFKRLSQWNCWWKKVPVFFSITGGSIYTLLCSLLSLVKPQEKAFDELKAELKKHFEPKRSSLPSISISTEETRHQTTALPSM